MNNSGKGYYRDCIKENGDNAEHTLLDKCRALWASGSEHEVGSPTREPPNKTRKLLMYIGCYCD